jgi:predicted SnoaL-like aldol condensation-catalyzing enzyme
MDTTQTNKKLVEAFCNQVIIGHDMSNLDQFIRADYIQHNADCPQGLEGFQEFFADIFRAVPDFSYSIKQIIAEGEFVWVYSRTTGTLTGGPWLGVQPRGQRLDFDVIDMFRIQDGKIAEHGDVADTYSFFCQLGRFQ